jgi:CheY-like chemotaxis protein
MQRPARILMVEDERIIAFDLRTRLTQMGHTVVGAVASEPEALVQAETLRPDLALMDIRLQEPMDGIEAAVVTHSHLDLPVVYLEGVCRCHDRRLCRRYPPCRLSPQTGQRSGPPGHAGEGAEGAPPAAWWWPHRSLVQSIFVC